MKKTLGILLAAVLLLTLTACGAPTPKATAAPSETPAPTVEPTATPAPASTVAVTAERWQETYTAEDGAELLYASYDMPVVHILGNESAAERINAAAIKARESFMTAEDEYNAGVDTALEEAKYAREQGYDGPGYAMESAFTVTRGDAAVLSYYTRFYANLGGPHGNTAFYGFNFDAETGEELSLDDLTTDAAALRAFAVERVTAMAMEDERADGLTEGYAELIPNNIADSYWYFDSEGITFIYNAYDIAPYAAGMFQFTIPYRELEGFIDAKWLPESASDAGAGEISCYFEEDAPAGEPLFTVTVDEGGARIVFRAEGSVDNVLLTFVQTADALEFYENGDLAYVNRMESGESFTVETYLPELMPNLRLTYVSGGETVTRYVAESGEDGSVFLMAMDGE